MPEQLFALCKTRTLEWHQMERVEKCCVVTEDFLQAEAKAFYQRNKGKPILLWWSADTTPLTARQAWVRGERTDLNVKRKGKASKDWLVQRCFMQSIDHDTIAVFQAPRVAGDKTVLTAMSALQSLVPLAHRRRP